MLFNQGLRIFLQFTLKLSCTVFLYEIDTILKVATNINTVLLHLNEGNSNVPNPVTRTLFIFLSKLSQCSRRTLGEKNIHLRDRDTIPPVRRSAIFRMHDLFVYIFISIVSPRTLFVQHLSSCWRVSHDVRKKVLPSIWRQLDADSRRVGPCRQNVRRRRYAVNEIVP